MGLVNVVIAFYYYARIIKAMYLTRDISSQNPLTITLPESLTMGTLGALILYFGIFFSPLLKAIEAIVP